jgi:hypothetical protein
MLQPVRHAGSSACRTNRGIDAHFAANFCAR